MCTLPQLNYQLNIVYLLCKSRNKNVTSRERKSIYVIIHKDELKGKQTETSLNIKYLKEIGVTCKTISPYIL